MAGDADSTRRNARRRSVGAARAGAASAASAPTERATLHVLTNKSGTPEEIIERVVTPHNVSHLVPPESPVSASERMGPLPTWLVVWLLVASLLVTWDSAYVLLRPYSMVGHPDAKPWAMIWTPYTKYGSIDGLYGLAGYEAFVAGKEGFNAAQSVINVVEVAMQVLVLYLARVKAHIGAHVVALVVLSFTLCKTMLYLLVEAFSNWAHVNAAAPAVERYFYYYFMNGLWIVMPALGIVACALRVLTVG